GGRRTAPRIVRHVRVKACTRRKSAGFSTARSYPPPESCARQRCATSEKSSTGGRLSGASEGLEIGIDHHLDQLLEADFLVPAQHRVRLAGVPDQQIDLGRPD